MELCLFHSMQRIHCLLHYMFRYLQEIKRNIHHQSILIPKDKEGYKWLLLHNVRSSVVSTIVSGILFARFPTVKHIPTISFLYDVNNCMMKKLKMKSTLYTILKHFFSTTLFSGPQHTHFPIQIFKTCFPLSFAVWKSSSFHIVNRIS